ncbi:hypothetical protein HDU85_007150 [Gaertneriomyces sp. JEL0708]|nr:hypothetical protein HDU85_007150 [Gaertneriomyces sp. JEL0708]
MSWWSLVLWVGVPWAIGKIRAYRQKNAIQRTPKPKSAWDAYSRYFLAAVALYQLLASMWQTDFGMCLWCRDQDDYAIHISPTIGLSYVTMLACAGLATLHQERGNWRTYSASILAAIAGAEAYYLFYLSTKVVDLQGQPVDQFHLAERWRRWAFAALAIGLAIFSGNDQWTEEDTLKELVEKNHVIYNRAQAARLARAATLGDSVLRKKFMEHYKEKEAANEAINRDLEYKEAREVAARKYNLTKMMEDTEILCGKIVKTAIDEGIIRTEVSEEVTTSKEEDSNKKNDLKRSHK